MTQPAAAWDAAVVNERNVMSKSPTAAESTALDKATPAPFNDGAPPDNERGEVVSALRQPAEEPGLKRLGDRLPAATAAPRKTRIADIFAHVRKRAFISAQLAIVLAVIAGGTALIAYEWHAAHAKPHHSPAASGSHHHKQKHEPHTAGNN